MEMKISNPFVLSSDDAVKVREIIDSHGTPNFMLESIDEAFEKAIFCIAQFGNGDKGTVRDMHYQFASLRDAKKIIAAVFSAQNI